MNLLVVFCQARRDAFGGALLDAFVAGAAPAMALVGRRC